MATVTQTALTTPGIIYSRKLRGRKLTFMIGGPTLTEAPDYIKWVKVAGYVFEFHGADGPCSILPPAKAPVVCESEPNGTSWCGVADRMY